MATHQESPVPLWPNAFSRHVGDKVFGLLIAAAAGAHVPLTTVIARRVAPFSFGAATGMSEKWLRTAPREPVPGRFTTQRGWRDPFELLHSEDIESYVASVISQEGVRSEYAGAFATNAHGDLVVEGARGFGDAYMLGKQEPSRLPHPVYKRVTSSWQLLNRQLGAVRAEWADDGEKCWILQLHRGAIQSVERTIFPGDPKKWIDVHVAAGLEELRSTVENIDGETGIRLVGDVGLLSHFGDVLRKARVPSVLLGREFR